MPSQSKKHSIFKLKGLRDSVHLIRTSFGEKNYLLILSIGVGLISGLAAVTLRAFVDYLHRLTGNYVLPLPGSEWILPALPAIGVLSCILFVRFLVRKPYEKGLAGVIHSTSNGTSEIPVQKTYSHILTSGICVGLGSSAGLEAPIALTGSAIGSNIGKLFHAGREGRTMLLACGGAAGVAAVFNSPVAGALFACEILLPEFSIPALIPLLIASASAAVVAMILYPGQALMIEVADWHLENIPFYLLLGVAAGFASALIIKASLLIGQKFEKYNNIWLKGLIGCVLMYFTFLTIPALRGEGYNFVNALVQGKGFTIMDGSPVAFLFQNPWTLLLLSLFLVCVKGPISSAGIACGGDGGIFAPSMFTGGCLGFFISRAAQMLCLPGAANICVANFIAIGMGGVLAGVMHAPMTGMFLIAEITGGYKLFIPLMLAVSTSYFVCRKICKFNVYKSVLAQKGEAPEQNKDAAALVSLTVGELAEKNFLSVRENDTLRTLLSTVMKSKRNIFPVLTEDGALAGIVTLDNIRPFLLNDQLYDVALVFDIMSPTGPVLDANDSLADATKLFESCHAWNLPVVQSGKYLGFVSKSGVFDRYRDLLKNKPDLF